MAKSVTITFVSSAFNELQNLQELHKRCRDVHGELRHKYDGVFDLYFRLVIADNCSVDDSIMVLEDLTKADPNVIALANSSNYGPEASAINALEQAGDSDITILLCSDLQDPPEFAMAMVSTLLDDPETDAVLAAKKASIENAGMKIVRRLYYKALGYSSRRCVVPSGFHGFGCYRKDVIEDTARYWKNTDLNLRQCLSNASKSPQIFYYAHAPRLHGASSYRGLAYWLEAIRALISGDAAASRIALLIGGGGLLLASLLALTLLFNFLSGNSGYGGGVPTVMALILLSFAVQMLMFALLSRQIEVLRMGGFRPKVRFRRIGQ